MPPDRQSLLGKGGGSGWGRGGNTPVPNLRCTQHRIRSEQGPSLPLFPPSSVGRNNSRINLGRLEQEREEERMKRNIVRGSPSQFCSLFP